MIKTTITINGTNYYDCKNLKITRTMDQANAASSFIATFDSPFGRHDDDFNIGDEIVIYAGDPTPTDKIFTGIVENITFNGENNKQELDLSGRDYAARLMDITVEPSVYTDSEISTIVSDLVYNSVEGITTNNIDVTSTTLERIAFRHSTVFEALTQLAGLAGFIFYVDADKDLHFELKDSTSTGQTLNNTNVYSCEFNSTRDGMYNDIWVYGDRALTGIFEKFDTDGAGSEFTLLNQPHNTQVSYLGSTLKGGIFGMTTAQVSGVDYWVNYFDRKLVFVSGTEYGYSKIPIAGGSILINYDKSYPIYARAQDSTSITAYGKKTLIVHDKSIQDPATARSIADQKLVNSNPSGGYEVNMEGFSNYTPGNTIAMVMANFGINEPALTISSVEYKFNRETIMSNRVIKLKLNNKVQDITDKIKDMEIRIRQLEAADLGELDAITRIKELTGSVVLIGSYWAVKYRSIGSSWVLASTSHGLLGSYANHKLGYIPLAWIVSGIGSAY